MTRDNPTPHHRRSIRLKGYNYSHTGAYFVTIVTHQKTCWFEQSLCRAIVEQEWYSLPERYPTIQLDEFVVMPNHVHFIVWLNPPDVGAQSGAQLVGAQLVGAQLNCAPTTIGQSFTVDRERPTLGQVVRTFKAVASRRIRQAGEEGFAWQRNYYERVIRNERELSAIRQYVRDNPAHWPQDEEYPSHD